MAEKFLGQVAIADLSSAVGICDGISKALSAVPAAGGSGYKVGDLLTLDGGTNMVADAVFAVARVDPNGAVVAVKSDRFRCGGYTAKPSNAVATTGGTGSGCTLTVTWSDDVPPCGATHAYVTVEAQTCRFRADGTAPTASVGTPMVPNAIFTFDCKLQDVQLIETTGTATATVVFAKS
jgi:flavin reductase (DIM6/NTAB) family NADH-FMN oxidoreductase RutF